MNANVILDMKVMLPLVFVRILTNVLTSKISIIVRRTLNVPMILVCHVFPLTLVTHFYLGTYKCTCLIGYFPIESNEHGAFKCEDIRECDLNASDETILCPPDGRCHTLDGEFQLDFSKSISQKVMSQANYDKAKIMK